MIQYCMHGASGKMGRHIIQAASKENHFELVGAYEGPDADCLGADAGIMAGIGPLGIQISSNLEECMRQAQVLIDFSYHTATFDALKVANSLKIPVVIGTTGFTAIEIEKIQAYAKNNACVMAPNMSIGINLLFKLVVEASDVLGLDYDVEILEAHHRWKKDAPSGTAKRFIELLASARGSSLEKDVVTGRIGGALERTPKEIASFSVRAGDIVGDHTIMFGGVGERIELTHRAHSRDTFAKGALRAASFVVSAKPGLYDMLDVLGLK
ncbi:MAG: 4-hydroxy-tetrahydrodipicolinate reductase [Chlamydiota bacterium]|nr:4-hydroxy-tetrahydrodipicolinate reductase [Chlamydiota bacterium]